MGKKLHIDKKIIVRIAIAAAVLLVAGGAGVLLWWLQNQQPNTKNPGFTGVEVPEQSKTLTSAQNLVAGGNSKDAETFIDEKLNDSSVSTYDRQQLWIQKAINYEEQKDLAKALEAYLEAEKVKSTFTTSHLIGETAQALGKKEMAAEYYKKALSQLDKASPSYTSNKRVYEAKLKEVGG